MHYKVILTELFEKEFKRLNKKYRSLRQDLRTLIENLELDPFQGEALGDSCYKIRLAITSKNSGKSGGARVITYISVFQGVAFLLSIYDKSEKESISKKDIKSRLSNIFPKKS